MLGGERERETKKQPPSAVWQNLCLIFEREREPLRCQPVNKYIHLWQQTGISAHLWLFYHNAARGPPPQKKKVVNYGWGGGNPIDQDFWM